MEAKAISITVIKRDSFIQLALPLSLSHIHVQTDYFNFNASTFRLKAKVLKIICETSASNIYVLHRSAIFIRFH